MAIIRMQRKKEYNNRLRNYQIFIDNTKAGAIANGEIEDFTVSAGQHTIKATIDWCSSKEVIVTVGENETKDLKVSGFKNGNWIMPLTGGIIALHFMLRILLQINYTIFLVIPAFLIIMYYLTFGRKKYLIIN